MRRFFLLVTLLTVSPILYALEISSTVESVYPTNGQVRFTLDNHPCVGEFEFYTPSISETSAALDAEYKAGFAVLLAALHSRKNVTITLNAANEVNCNAGAGNGLIWVGEIIGKGN